MNTDFGLLASSANPFAALLCSEASVAAHVRLGNSICATAQPFTGHSIGVVPRPS